MTAGDKIGRWEIVSPAVKYLASGKKRSAFNVRCECGTEKIVEATSLRSGDTKSCGCLNAELGIERRTTHGKTGTAEYRVWCHMIGRCHNETDDAYPRYGGRGIAVCARWRDSFSAFIDDMGPRPSLRHSVERVQNEGDYEPENCIWATDAEQCRNRRSNRHVMLDGVTMVVSDAETTLGICRGSIYQIVKKQGITYQQAIDRYAARRAWMAA